MTKFDGGNLSNFPAWGEPHISETAYVQMRRDRGQVCVEPHINVKKGESPIAERGCILPKKQMGATAYAVAPIDRFPFLSRNLHLTASHHGKRRVVVFFRRTRAEAADHLYGKLGEFCLQDECVAHHTDIRTSAYQRDLVVFL